MEKLGVDAKRILEMALEQLYPEARKDQVVALADCMQKCVAEEREFATDLEIAAILVNLQDQGLTQEDFSLRAAALRTIFTNLRRQHQKEYHFQLGVRMRNEWAQMYPRIEAHKKRKVEIEEAKECANTPAERKAVMEQYKDWTREGDALAQEILQFKIKYKLQRSTHSRRKK